MVEISEEEYREYMYLKRKEAERIRAIEETLKKGIPQFKKWREDLNSVRGYAAVFVKILNEEWEKRGQPDSFVLDRLRVVFQYLPDFLLTKKKGKIYIKKYFRECLRQYGWSVRIDHKYGLFEVFKNI